MGALLVEPHCDGFPDPSTPQFNRDPNVNYVQGYANSCDYGYTTLCDPDGAIHVYKNDQQGNFPNDDTLTTFPSAPTPGTTGLVLSCCRLSWMPHLVRSRWSTRASG